MCARAHLVCSKILRYLDHDQLTFEFKDKNKQDHQIYPRQIHVCIHWMCPNTQYQGQDHLTAICGWYPLAAETRLLSLRSVSKLYMYLCVIPTRLVSATWILSCHSSPFWAKSLNIEQVALLEICPYNFHPCPLCPPPIVWVDKNLHRKTFPHRHHCCHFGHIKLSLTSLSYEDVSCKSNHADPFFSACGIPYDQSNPFSQPQIFWSLTSPMIGMALDGPTRESAP